MPMLGVSHCPSCQAIINVKWHTCPACHGVINGMQAAPFAVGDMLTYQVPRDPKEKPFEVIMVSPDHYQGGWWALVAKKDSHVWIHKVLVVKVDGYK